MRDSEIVYDNKSLYETNIPLMVSHLNYGNHLGYDSVFSIIQDARMRWLSEHGMKEISLEQDVGYLIIHASSDYKSEAFFGDVLKIEFYPNNIKRTSFDLIYRISNLKTGTVIANTKTSQKIYDFSRKKIVRTPDRLTKIFEKYCDET